MDIIQQKNIFAMLEEFAVKRFQQIIYVLS